MIAKGAYSIKLPNALIDCSIPGASPSPSMVLVFPRSNPVLKAKDTANTDRRDAYKSVISIIVFCNSLIVVL